MAHGHDYGEVYVSVDGEMDGPVPGLYSMVALGAVDAYNTERRFYREMKPLHENGDPESVAFLAANGYDRERLIREGSDPGHAMHDFVTWLATLAKPGRRLVFVGLSAPFDWMFVQYYLVRFTQCQPFGTSGLDIKALYMGLYGVPLWRNTSKQYLDATLKPTLPHTHNALDDALEQAELFRTLHTQITGDRRC